MPWLREHITPSPIRGLLLAVTAGAVDLAVWRGSSQLIWGGDLPLWVVPALTVAVAGTLLLRRSHPVTVFGVQWAYSLTNLVLPEYFPFACLLVALYAVASRTEPRTARMTLLACAGPLGVFSYRSGATAAGYVWAQLVESAIVWLLVAVVVWGLGRSLHAREQQAIAERARLALEAEQALQAERLRLARELHDSVSGTVAGMIMQAAGARAVCAEDDRRVPDALTAIAAAGQEAMTELHRMLGLLRTPDPDPDPTHTALARISGLLDRARAAGLAVVADTAGEPRPLAPETDLAAYRVVQESLTNAAKHAGSGAAVVVATRWGPDEVAVEVRSSGGTGPTTETGSLSTGHGLRGLRERVELLGGSLDTGPTSGGWSVRARLPAPRRQADAADGR